jgi:hypothetical protein
MDVSGKEDLQEATALVRRTSMGITIRICPETSRAKTRYANPRKKENRKKERRKDERKGRGIENTAGNRTGRTTSCPRNFHDAGPAHDRQADYPGTAAP